MGGEAFRPATVIEYATVVDTDPNLVGIKIVLIYELHWIGSDNRHSNINCESHGGIYVFVFSAIADSAKLQIKPVSEHQLILFNAMGDLFAIAG